MYVLIMHKNYVFIHTYMYIHTVCTCMYVCMICIGVYVHVWMYVQYWLDASRTHAYFMHLERALHAFETSLSPGEFSSVGAVLNTRFIVNSSASKLFCLCRQTGVSCVCHECVTCILIGTVCTYVGRCVCLWMYVCMYVCMHVCMYEHT